MSPRTGPAAILLHYLLVVVLVKSAPVASPLKEAAERAKTLVEKILKDLPPLHTSTVHTQGLTFDQTSTNLLSMMSSLDIPSAPPLKPLSEQFTLDMSVRNMAAGCQLYQNLLEVLSSWVSGLSDLQADLRDLQTQIDKMALSVSAGTISAGTISPAPTLDLSSDRYGNFEVQVATHLTLTQLRLHCRDLIRSLRAAAAYRPRPLGTQ